MSRQASEAEALVCNLLLSGAAHLQGRFSFFCFSRPRDRDSEGFLALPLIRSIAGRVRLREILLEHIPSSDRQSFARADLILRLAVNLTLAKDPLYELAQWMESLDLRALGYDPRPEGVFSADRFAGALDQLFEVRSHLLTDPPGRLGHSGF